MTYDYMGNKVVIEMNENRKLILDAMKSLKDGGVSEVRPSDVIKYYGEKATSKKGKNISRTMQRMADDFEIQSLPKYGFYSLITPEDLNKNLNHDHF